MPVFSIPLSGLNSASAALSTIANNLANINTVAYKDATTRFKDLFYQTVGSTGGGDPIQVGAGSTVATTESNFTPGSVETTGVPSDVAIGGDGFFVVSKDGVLSYTRAGNFITGDDGTLQTIDGQQVLGYPAVNGVVSQLQGLSPLMVGSGYTSPPNATTTVSLPTNLDAGADDGTVYTTPVSVYDSLGQPHSLTFQFTKTGGNQWQYDITVPGQDVGSTNASVNIGTGTLTFDTNGNLSSPIADISGITMAGLADGAADLTFTWKLFSGTGSTVTQVASPSTTSSTDQDGYGSGSLLSFAVGSDGVVEGTFSNQKSMVLGQLVLAKFANVQGLQREGDNQYSPTLSSGEAVIGAPGTGGRGNLSGGALELSNVDISQEFTKLITAQRGFEANAKTITSYDEIMQDTINLMR